MRFRCVSYMKCCPAQVFFAFLEIRVVLLQYGSYCWRDLRSLYDVKLGAQSRERFLIFFSRWCCMMVHGNGRITRQCQMAFASSFTATGTVCLHSIFVHAPHTAHGYIFCFLWSFIGFLMPNLVAAYRAPSKPRYECAHSACVFEKFVILERDFSVSCIWKESNSSNNFMEHVALPPHFFIKNVGASGHFVVHLTAALFQRGQSANEPRVVHVVP